VTLDLYRKRPGGQTRNSRARLGPGRFGSSRKKEAAGAACTRLLAMGFECRFFLAASAIDEVFVERRERDRRGRQVHRVHKRVPESRKTRCCGVQTHFEEGAAGSTGKGEGGGMTKKVVEIGSGAKKQVRGRPFEPGNKMGRGRPKGSRNKTNPGQALLDEYAEPIMRKCIVLAMQGDRSAMRLCVERISPARHGACIRMKLPPIKIAADVDKAAEKVTQAMGRAKITPTDGLIMMNVLEKHSGMIESVQMESDSDGNRVSIAEVLLQRRKKL